MKIPRILHQTWKTEEVPPPFEKFMNTWKECHPLWLHILWTDATSRAFIESYFPDFLSTYDGYETNIQRVDAARYFILNYFGGVYADMDFECFKNIEPIVKDETCILGMEHDEHCRIHNKEIIISNAFMACTPQHTFMGELCKEVASRERKRYSKNDRILESTGPFMLTRVFQNFSAKHLVKVLPNDILYPLNKNEANIYLSGSKMLPGIHEKMKNAYAVHYYWGTWWKSPKKRRSISIFGRRISI